MFIGKYADRGTPEGFAEMGRALGYEAAAQGAEIVVGSDSPSTLDAAVVDGAAAFARSSGLSVPWSVYEPTDQRRRYEHVPEGLTSPRRQVFETSERRWQAAHLAAVRLADGVVAVGGHDNTYRAWKAASEYGRPVWPLPTFGGAAAEAFATLSIGRWDRAHAKALKAAEPALHARSAAAIAARWIAQALRSVFRRLRKPRRVYFLSHSRENLAEVDHVEVLLRREKRGVLRDERDFPPAAPLDQSMEQAIASADDVVVLDSSQAAGSGAVKKEIAIASRLVDAHGDARRLVGILLEGMPPRTSLDPRVLHLSGTTRPEREGAVRMLVVSEPR